MRRTSDASERRRVGQLGPPTQQKVRIFRTKPTPLDRARQDLQDDVLFIFIGALCAENEADQTRSLGNFRRRSGAGVEATRVPQPARNRLEIPTISIPKDRGEKGEQPGLVFTFLLPPSFENDTDKVPFTERKVRAQSDTLRRCSPPPQTQKTRKDRSTRSTTTSLDRACKTVHVDREFICFCAFLSCFCRVC